MTSSQVARQARAADLPGMAEALAESFHDDPVMCWLFGDTPPRPQAYTRRYFAREGARHLRAGHVYTLDGTPGAAMWDPPGHWRTRPLDLMRAAPLMAAGLRSRTLRALRGLARMEALHGEQPEHYYLAFLGTRPQRQGEGIGRTLLAPVLDRCDLDGVGAYLESSKESNISYYRRFGFDVVGEVEFPSGPRLWAMWRDPRPPGDTW